MSWIKENQFTAGLAAVTLLGIGGLYFWGSGSQETTALALENYQTAASQINNYEGGRLYPSETNRDLKRKAVSDYSNQAHQLRDRMVQYAPKPGPVIASNAFGTELQAATARVRTAFGASKAALPAGFLLGFESYSTNIANEDATSLMAYQVGAMEWLFGKLADARPASLINVYRKPLPEEKSGQAYAFAKGQVSRDLPLEITFSGSAHAMREFLGSLVDSKEYYFIPRIIRVENEKQTGPTRSDAQFKTASTSGVADAAFDPAAFDAKPAGGVAADPAAVDAAAAAASEPILKQVLGDELLKVFLRIDLRVFRDAASVPLPELPKSL